MLLYGLGKDRISVIHADDEHQDPQNLVPAKDSKIVLKYYMIKKICGNSNINNKGSTVDKK